VVTALQRRPELLTEQGGTALERYRLFCDVLKAFGMRRAVAREVLLLLSRVGSCKSYVAEPKIREVDSTAARGFICKSQYHT